jgi:hypothetical protein
MSADQGDQTGAVQVFIHGAVFFAYWALATCLASILIPVQLLKGVEKNQKTRYLLKLSISFLLVGSAAGGFATFVHFGMRNTFAALGSIVCLILLGVAVWVLQVLSGYHSISGVPSWNNEHQNEAIELMKGCLLALLAVIILAVAGFFSLILIFPTVTERFLGFFSLLIGIVLSSLTIATIFIDAAIEYLWFFEDSNPWSVRLVHAGALLLFLGAIAAFLRVFVLPEVFNQYSVPPEVCDHLCHLAEQVMTITFVGFLFTAPVGFALARISKAPSDLPTIAKQ